MGDGIYPSGQIYNSRNGIKAVIQQFICLWQDPQGCLDQTLGWGQDWGSEARRARESEEPQQSPSRTRQHSIPIRG